tara:strand:+ start:2026 stop:2487 length:462 start_codon:yes stop_codon:yes gene_type:complete
MAANADNLMMSFFLDWQTNWAGQDPNYDFRSHIRHRRLVQSERAMRASLKNILIKQARDPGEDPVYVSALNRLNNSFLGDLFQPGQGYRNIDTFTGQEMNAAFNNLTARQRSSIMDLIEPDTLTPRHSPLVEGSSYAGGRLPVTKFKPRPDIE